MPEQSGEYSRQSRKTKEFLDGWRERKRQQEYLASLKSRKQALREICEAGDEYRRDGFGTAQQIAHELAYWVIDLHRETGGKASEGELKNAASQGYVDGNCSMY